MANKQINHKELLTFSNLTNLEWQFVDLEGIKEGDYETGQGTMSDISTQLNDLLKPELFVRYDEESKYYSYSYPKNTTKKDQGLTDEEKEEGLFEMRQHAGIAMEYC